MNVQAITLNIVDALSKQASTTSPYSQQQRRDDATDEFALLTKQHTLLTDDDRTKINAIDWIVYESSQRLKLLEYANLTMRYFLLERRNFDATRLVFGKIPGDTMAVVLSQYTVAALQPNLSSLNNSVLSTSSLVGADSGLNSVIESLPSKVANSVKEYLCFKEYIVRFNVLVILFYLLSICLFG